MAFDSKRSFQIIKQYGYTLIYNLQVFVYFCHTSVECAEAVDPSDVKSSFGAVGYNLSGVFPLPESSPDGLCGGVLLEITPISISLG